MSLWALGYGVAFAVLALPALRPVSDNSFLWHVTAGDIQRLAGSVITADPFSYVAQGEAWLTQSWLAELLYSWMFDRFGLRSVGVLVLIMGWVMLSLVGVILAMRGPISAGLSVVVCATAVHFLAFLQPRPVLFSYPLFASVVLALAHPRLRWTVPLIIWVWASVHGSFPLAFIYLAGKWFEERHRDYLRVLMAGVAAATFTAHGTGIWYMLIEFVRVRDTLDIIVEWQPPDLLDIRFVPVTAALLFGISYVARNGLSGRAGLPLAAWFLFGLTSMRAMPMFWISSLPFLGAVASSDTLPIRGEIRLPRVVAISASIVVAAAPLAGPISSEFDSSRLPVVASTMLKGERVFHDDITGGYLIFTSWPERKVMIDDRAELYGERLVAIAKAISTGDEWRRIFDEYGIDEALLRSDSALAHILPEAGWSVAYQDDTFTVLRPNP